MSLSQKKYRLMIQAVILLLTSGDTPDEPESEAVDKTASEPEPVPDPTEPFITVQDINGKDFKITKIEDLPEDFVPKNNRDALAILQQLDRLDRDTQTAQEKARADAEAKQLQEAQAAQSKSWDSEIEALQKEGRMPVPKADPKSDKFAEDPAVKKVEAVFKFMAETNDKRAAAGNPNPLRSFEDALDKYELAESRKAEAEADKADNQTAKDKAALIGRTSAVGGDVPAYFAGQYSSMDDIV